MASPEETRVKNLESELSLLKNQVQQTLLDIREHVLEFTNPFTAEARLVRAWQERTAQAAQTNLGGEADLESLLETDDEILEEAPAPAAATATAPPPADDDDWDEFEDEEPLDVAPQATAAADDDPELDLEPEVNDTGPEAQPLADFEDEPFGDGEWEDPYEEDEDDLGAEYDDTDEITDIEQDDGEVEEMQVEESEVPSPLEQEPVSEQPAPPEPNPAEAAPQPQPPVPAPQESVQQILRKAPGMDMITLISLVRWVDKNTERIGKDRVMVILDIYAMSGRITEETRDIVKRLCALGRNDETRVPVRDVVAAMLTIDGVLDERVSESQRLMSMLYDEPLGGLSQDGAGLLP
ncbi:MAG: hypothetical protein IIC93_01305 [Chloroflexi bacterium]|nr:hypothetical protein [Chloroflexota bacterium]